jgi:hypothetical protein
MNRRLVYEEILRSRFPFTLRYGTGRITPVFFFCINERNAVALNVAIKE